jgi:hypothetical protein
MSLARLTPEEREVARRAMAATFQFFDDDFHPRLGVDPETMRSLLSNWPNVDDADDDSDACLAINNTLNDLLHGVGISEREALELTGVGREELQRIYRKWARERGWNSTGIR